MYSITAHETRSAGAPARGLPRSTRGDHSTPPTPRAGVGLPAVRSGVPGASHRPPMWRTCAAAWTGAMRSGSGGLTHGPPWMWRDWGRSSAATRDSQRTGGARVIEDEKVLLLTARARTGFQASVLGSHTPEVCWCTVRWKAWNVACRRA